mmetsp:Transcript_134407/g.287526  ORF Transcript_134407/g.287526 Transcript_134407/m.287526 type:complete len:241 (-) Transcript_134407:135-857(-)
MEGELRGAAALRQGGQLLKLPLLEEDLHCEYLPGLVPIRKELVIVLVDLHVRHLEAYGLVGVAREEEILKLRLRRLYLLLVGRHEAVSRLGLIRHLGILDLEEQSLLLCLRVPLLRHPVPWSTDLHRFSGATAHVRLGLDCRILLLLRRPPCQVDLVLFPLCVCEVAALVRVECQAQLALVAAEVIAKEIRVLREIDGLQGQFAEPLTTVHSHFLVGGRTTGAHLVTDTVLEIHLGDGLS